MMGTVPLNLPAYTDKTRSELLAMLEAAEQSNASLAAQVAELRSLLAEIRPMFSNGRAQINNDGNWLGGGIFTWFDRCDEALSLPIPGAVGRMEARVLREKQKEQKGK